MEFSEVMLNLYKYTDKEKEALRNSMVILVDTREQKNDHVLKYFDDQGVKYKSQKLDYGDYSFMLPKNEELSIPRDISFAKEIMVERKGSLEEISGNLTNGRDRLEKEFALAPKNKVLLIENATYGDMVMGNYDTKYNRKSFWSSIHSFWHKYDIPVFFLGNNKFSGMFIRGYFEYYLHNIIK